VPICGTVSQISPPIRIVLVAAIGLVAAWMLFLRPKTEATPAPTPAPATAPGVTGLSDAVDKAKDAASAQEKRDAKVQKATGDDEGSAKAGKSESKGGSTTALVSGRVLPLEPLGAEQTEGLPRSIVRALDNRRVFVVGIFDTKQKRWAQMATDDRRVRRELSKVNRYDGKVVVARSSLGKLSKLNAIVGDLGVSQTPSVVVVDRNRKAVVLTGFVERHAINQVVQDARRNSTERRIKDPFVRRINETCANFFLRADRWNMPTSRSQVKPALRRWEGIMASYSASFASLKAPAKYRGVRNQVAGVVGKLESYGAALRSGNSARINSSYTALLASDAALNRKFADMGATTCNTDHRS
jgi:hypothetical protein